MRRVLNVAVVTVLAASCAASSPEVTAGQSTKRPSPTEPTDPTKPPDPATTSISPNNTNVTPDPARGIGDVLFPDLGNPGIDVVHYDVDLMYTPGVNTLQVTETLSIAATANLADFSLDSAGPRIASVAIGGKPANFVEQRPELVITPPVAIASGSTFEVIIVYSVTPQPAGSIDGLPDGWFPTSAGSYVVNEPDGARTWLPSNDHPVDKATFAFTIHVPSGLTGVANGQLVDHTSSPTGETWTWSETEPMATYLIQVLTGSYSIINGTGPNGLPLTSAVLTADVAKMQPFVDAIPSEIDFFDNYFGSFPLQSYGIAITDSPPGLAMEEQGRSLFSRDDFSSGQVGEIQQLLLSHELAHQWFGDAVSPAQWQDIWLNESFATYCEWMWMEHVGANPLTAEVDAALSKRQRGSISTGRPPADAMFGFEVYEGGAVVLHALRLTIGDSAFFNLLRSWAQQNVGTSRTSADFITLAEHVAGRDLTSFFNDWLYATTLPASLPAGVN